MAVPGRLALAVLVPTTFALVTGCGGSPRQQPAKPAPPMRLVAYDSCAELLKGLRTATAARVGPYGLPGAGNGMLRDGRAILPNAAEGAISKTVPQHSTTNVHEQGADEPDVVKTDGRRIVTVSRGRLVIVDPATRKVTHRLDLGEDTRTLTSSADLLLNGDRALVLIRRPYMLPMEGVRDVPRNRFSPQLRLLMVDLSGTPRVTDRLTANADYLDARQTGSVARIVVRSTPRIDFPLPSQSDSKTNSRQATERNRQIVNGSPLEAWLPAFEVRAEGATTGKTFRTPCDQVSRPATNTGTSMVTVLTLDLAKPLGDPQPISVAADGETVYGTGKSLYVTGTPAMTSQEVSEYRTDVHKFDTAGAGRPRYLASGSVPGSLLGQYALSEYAGNLRVATTSFSAPSKSSSSVHILTQRGPTLETVGKVTGLGKNERIYAVRFLGPTGYVVTFRQVDPLYVLDLRDATHPKTTGELKISGYSAYLHPTADGRLLGIGQDADDNGRTRGTQVSLFDVTSTATPRRLSQVALPDTTSAAEYDPHAFLYWPASGLTVVPLNNGMASEALVLSVDAKGVRKLGTVRHPGSQSPGASSISRSLIVGDSLWTISEAGARVTDAATLASRAWLPF